jgi:hypothetical protein
MFKKNISLLLLALNILLCFTFIIAFAPQQRKVSNQFFGYVNYVDGSNIYMTGKFIAKEDKINMTEQEVVVVVSPTTKYVNIINDPSNSVTDFKKITSGKWLEIKTTYNIYGRLRFTASEISNYPPPTY